MALRGIEKLGADPAVQVIVTDSQGALEAAARLFPQLHAVLANGAAGDDWLVLTGRRVVLMLSAGQDDAARALAALLAPFALEVKLVLPEPERAAGWSLASEPAWDNYLAGSWARSRGQIFKAPASAQPDISDVSDRIPAPQGAEAVTPGHAEPSPPSYEGSPDQSPAVAGTAQTQQEPPPDDVPPVGSLTPPGGRRRRKRPDLSLVDGNLARAPDPDDEPLPADLSEDSFGDDFAAQHGNDWRCVRAWGQWLHWDSEAWLEDRDDSRFQPMRELYRYALQRPIAQQLTLASRQKLGKQGSIYSSMRLAGTDARIRSTPELWDADPFMLGVAGGVVDLRAGKLVESAREQFITMRSPVAPAAGKPATWLKMLNYWLGGDEDVIGFLRRYLGYCLTGDGREQCMMFFYGPAQSGKGTILRAISYVLGSVPPPSAAKTRSYHYEAPIATFLESRNDRHTTELAAMHQKRLITSEEPAAGAKWDEAKIKWMTGGQFITARYMRGDNFSFAMTGKIIVAANHRPRLSTTDASIRRRMHVLPFEHPVADEDRDNALDARLRAESPQILAWLIEACLEWQQCGLGLPEKIATATDTYLQAEDIIAQWIDEACERGRDAGSAELYGSYCKWAEEHGEKVWSRRAWANALVERGFQTRKGTAGVRMFVGLAPALRPSDTQEQPQYYDR